MEWLFFVVAIICLIYFLFFSLIERGKVEVDCDNCEYASECRKRIDMMEERE